MTTTYWNRLPELYEPYLETCYLFILTKKSCFMDVWSVFELFGSKISTVRGSTTFEMKCYIQYYYRNLPYLPIIFLALLVHDPDLSVKSVEVFISDTTIWKLSWIHFVSTELEFLWANWYYRKWSSENFEVFAYLTPV